MTVYYSSLALVLGSRDYGEADRIISFYSKEHGRIEAFAKSVRNSNSKLKGHLAFFSLASIMFIGRYGEHRLIDAYQVSGPKDWNFEELKYLSDFSRFFLRVVTGSEADGDIWNVLCDISEGRKSIVSPEKLFILKVQLLRILGLVPEEGLADESQLEAVLMANHMI